MAVGPFNWLTAAESLLLKRWQVTLLSAVVGWLTAGCLLNSGRGRYAMLPAYFALAQTLQVMQFPMLDLCHTSTNQLLTLLSYTHIALQPLLLNEFFWGQPQPSYSHSHGSSSTTPFAGSIIHKSLRKLCWAAAALMMLKASPAVLRVLGLGHSHVEQVFGPAVSKMVAGPPSWHIGSIEALSGAQLCSFRGSRHTVAWVLPLMEHSPYIPSKSLHMFLSFAPALVLGGTYQRLLAAGLLLTGPVVASQLVGSNERAQAYEWHSVWMALSVGQVLLLLLAELLVAKLATGRCRLPGTDSPLKLSTHHRNQGRGGTHPWNQGLSTHHRSQSSTHHRHQGSDQGSYEARDAETTAVITLYQQQHMGYKQQQAGYGKLL